MNVLKEAYENLRMAIVKRAADDYRIALKTLKRRPKDINSLGTKMECERFFREDIGAYSDLDGEMIIKGVRERVERENE